jgi:hypothetical protein
MLGTIEMCSLQSIGKNSYGASLRKIINLEKERLK